MQGLKFSVAKVTELDKEVQVMSKVMGHFESLHYPNVIRGLFRQPALDATYYLA